MTEPQTWQPRHSLPILPIGTVVPPFGTIKAVLLLSGERYYHLIDEDGCVSMIPDDEGFRNLVPPVGQPSRGETP